MIIWFCALAIAQLLGQNEVIGETHKHPANDRLDCVLTGRVDRGNQHFNFFEIWIEPKIPKEECLRRGCLWEKASVPETPWCFFDKHQPSYRVKSPTPTKTATGFESRLVLTEAGKRQTSFPQAAELKLTVHQLSDHIVRFKIEDANVKRYEVPVQKHFHLDGLPKPNKPVYEVSLAESFNLTITQKETGTRL